MRLTCTTEQLAAAYLADPLRVPPPGFPWSECTAQAVLRTLQENKVPLVALAERPDAGRLLQDSAIATARSQELQSLEIQRREYRLVRERLLQDGLEGVLIKSVGLLPTFPYRSDNLDVLYRPEDVPLIRSRLRELGYVELRNVEEPHKYLFRKFRGGHSVSAIHVHAHVGWMVSFLDEDALWKRVRRSPEDELVLLPAIEDGLATALAHYFYEDKRVVLQDVRKLAHCARQGVDWDEVYRIADMRGWRDGLDVSLLVCSYQEQALYGEASAPQGLLDRAHRELPGWVRSRLERQLGEGALAGLCQGEPREGRDWLRDLPLRIPFVFSKYFFYAKLVRDPSRTRGRKVKDLAVHTANGTKLRLHIHSQPSMLVTLSGLDGCGKSTHAHALQAAFGTCHLRADYVWTRAGSAGWLSTLTHLLRGRGGGTTEPTDKAAARQLRFRSGWRRWGWSWLTTGEMVGEYLRRVAWPLWRGRIVICDRYTYDTMADWSANFAAAAENSLAARVLQWLSPKPRLAYWLDLPAEVAHERAQGALSREFMSLQGAAYQRMADRHGLHRMDAQQDLSANSDALVFDVLGNYFARYRTWVNHLFLKNPGQWI